MKINITSVKRVPRPTQPSVSLSQDAYIALLDMSDKHNISMRRLASEIILQACKNLEVEKSGK